MNTSAVELNFDSISGNGTGFHWEELDEDISVQGLLMEELDEDISVQGLLMGLGDRTRTNRIAA